MKLFHAIGASGAIALAGAAFAQCESSQAYAAANDSCENEQAQGAQVVLASNQMRGDIVETAMANDDFTTLVAAVKAADLVETLQGDGPFTVFAPTDAAFEKLSPGTLETLLRPENKGTLQAILTYHVVPGEVMAADVVGLDSARTVNGQRIDIQVENGVVMVDNAEVVATDVQCSNGVIHVIDEVILPSTDDIIDTALSAGQFGTLATALRSAGLVEALRGDGPFTVFAPTDAAFDKLPEGALSSLLEPGNRSRLQTILKNHVVSGRLYAEDVLSSNRLETLQGTTLTPKTRYGSAYIGDAKIIGTNVEASNGVIHVIDSVLLPN